MTTTLDLYPTQFHHYLARNLRYVLGLVHGAGPVLSDEVRGQALHTLSYALHAPAVWPLTRELFLTLAPKMEQGGQREHWIPYLQEALRQSEAQGDGAAAGECHFQLALLYRLMSHFTTAYEHLQAALTYFIALGARRDQARVLNELAWLEHLQYRYDDASRHVEQVITLLEPDDVERAMSYRVQGMIAIGHHQWHEAKGYHQKALILFEKHQDRRRVAWSLQNLAYVLAQEQNYSEAFPLYLQAATILEEISDDYHLAIVIYNLAFAQTLSGQAEDAAKHYTQAHDIFYKLGAKLHLGRLHTDCGLNHLTLKNYVQAEFAFSQSISFFTELDLHGQRLNAIDGLAMAYLGQHKYQQAIDVLEKAMQELSVRKNLPNYSYLQKSLYEHWHEAVAARNG
jgi:tetratricopeptide (TPR) repeat protein